MSDNVTTADEAAAAKVEPSSDSVAGPEIDSNKTEESQGQGNHLTAICEAAQQAEKAVSDAVKGMAQVIEAMRAGE